MAISLTTLLPIPDPTKYKVHLASWNGEKQPLDSFVRDREEWDEWNSWRGAKDDFNRAHILSLIDFYPSPGLWLFGGLYNIKSRLNKNYSCSYKIERMQLGDELVGRLKVRFERPSRTKALIYENYIEKMVVVELLQEPYSGEVFCGYDNINLDFRTLEVIFKANRLDWKTALENAKGVYLIVDKSNGKKYVGAAYGETGIWSRWGCYIETGHGGNDELIRLINKEGFKYAERNFKFSILEYRSMKTDDDTIINREEHWKDVLLTKKFGYNKK